MKTLILVEASGLLRLQASVSSVLFSTTKCRINHIRSVPFHLLLSIDGTPTAGILISCHVHGHCIARAYIYKFKGKALQRSTSD